MDNMGLGKSDPFLMVEKGKENVHRTNIVKDNLNPVWDPFMLRVAQVDGPDAPFFLRVYDHDSGSSHDLIGEAKVTIREISQSNEVFPLSISSISQYPDLSQFF